MHWEFYQQQVIRGVERKAAEGTREAARLERDLTTVSVELRSAIDKIVLVNRALWELLSERHGLEEADLDKKIEEIDLRDGVADGRMGTSEATCAGCGRKARGERANCLYCGHALDR